MQGTTANEVTMAGYFLQAAGRALVNLRILGGSEAEALLHGVAPDDFFPSPRFHAILGAVRSRFRDFDPVLERMGVEMMRDWYEHGPGKSIVQTGVAFLQHQTGSQGYRSVVGGPDHAIGEFRLEALDVAAGTARVRSSTPFPRALERGVLLGGMGAPGDFAFIDVTNSQDESVFEIRFH